MILKFSHFFKTLSFRMPLGMRNLLFSAFFSAVALFPHMAKAQVQAPTSRIIPPPPSFKFPEGQNFVYSVQWHMLSAGTTTIFITRSGSAEHLHSTADTSGMTNKIYRVHDIFDADIDSRTFCTQAITRHAEEGSRRLNRKIQFDYTAAKSHVDDVDLKTAKKKHSEFDVPPCVSDVVTGFFYASSLSLAPGLSETFPVNDGGKTSDVRIEVEGRSTIKVPAGEFHTVRVRAEPITGPLKGKGMLWVWFTDDRQHTPVQMKSKLGFATLLFQLQRMDPQSR
ncbi:MAG TPA: DUF3108 domain-containing protein [Terriglobales bacterium]|nr:DUF3108 domain-containing protein [Terriglobales bacterium]